MLAIHICPHFECVDAKIVLALIYLCTLFHTPFTLMSSLWMPGHVGVYEQCTHLLNDRHPIPWQDCKSVLCLFRYILRDAKRGAIIQEINAVRSNPQHETKKTDDKYLIPYQHCKAALCFLQYTLRMLDESNDAGNTPSMFQPTAETLLCVHVSDQRFSQYILKRVCQFEKKHP